MSEQADRRRATVQRQRLGPEALLQNARLEPFMDQADNPLVTDAVFDKADQPVMADRVERSHDTLPTSRSRGLSGSCGRIILLRGGSSKSSDG